MHCEKEKKNVFFFFSKFVSNQIVTCKYECLIIIKRKCKIDLVNYKKKSIQSVFFYIRASMNAFACKPTYPSPATVQLFNVGR